MGIIEFYEYNQKKYPEAVILMKCWSCYEVYGYMVEKILPTIKKAISQDLFNYTLENRACLCFKVCDIEKFIYALKEARFRIAIISYNDHMKSPEYKADVEKAWKRFQIFHKAVEQAKKKKAVELELKFEW